MSELSNKIEEMVRLQVEKASEKVVLQAGDVLALLAELEAAWSEAKRWEKGYVSQEKEVMTLIKRVTALENPI